MTQITKADEPVILAIKGAPISRPLYITGIDKDLHFMLGGIFEMQDTVGFPLDCCYEEAKLRHYHIDWLEALCSCWINDCLKFDSFVRQAENCTGIPLEAEWKTANIFILNKFPKMLKCSSPIDVSCWYILAKKGKFKR